MHMRLVSCQRSPAGQRSSGWRMRAASRSRGGAASGRPVVGKPEFACAWAWMTLPPSSTAPTMGAILLFIVRTPVDEVPKLIVRLDMCVLRAKEALFHAFELHPVECRLHIRRQLAA